MKSLVLTASIAVLFSACSQGRKQYKAPADQRVDQTAGPADIGVPSTPSNPAASLVEGWYVDPTPEEVAAKLSEATRSPIVPTVGMAGVSTTMSRSEIEAKVGQPDFVSRDSYQRPVAVYGSGAFLVFYDRVTKNKVEMLVASGGYTGSLSTFPDLKMSSDLAPVFAANGGPEAFMKKLYQASHPSVEDCTKEQLCQLIKGQGLALLTLSNTISILFQDEAAKATKTIFEIRVSARNPDAGAFNQESWNFDLLSGTLQNENARIVPGVSTWGDVRSAGDLAERVEERDFGRGLVSYGLGLENSLGFAFERPDFKAAKDLSPQDSARLTNVSAGEAFLGTYSVGSAPLEIELCASESPVPNSPESLLKLSLKGLNASETGELEPSAEAALSSLWTVRVRADGTPTREIASGCVREPLRAALDATLRSVLERAVANAVSSAYPDEAKRPPAFSVAVTGELKVEDLFDTAGGALEGAPLQMSQALSRLLFQQTSDETVAQAKASLPPEQANLLKVYPLSGAASLEEQQTVESSFIVYKDASLKEGVQITVAFFESSQNIYFDVELIRPEFRNTNAALSVLKEGTVDLDRPLVFGDKGFFISSSAGPGSLASLNLFDRSLRFGELDGVDPFAYAERVSVNVTDGLQSKNHIYDFQVVWNDISLYGSRKDGDSISQASLQVEAIEAGGFPSGTEFLMSCGTETLTVRNGASFRSVYTQLNGCGLFLTAGYATENVPTELHIAPSGARTHGLTLKFGDGLLNGFLIYDINSLAL